MDGMSLEERRDYMQNAAIKYIGNRVAKNMPSDYRTKRATDVINRYLLPHMGTEPERCYDKAIYLAEMTEMLLEVIEQKENLTTRTITLTKDSEYLET